jgi:predicted O-methyltransferase YrrM
MALNTFSATACLRYLIQSGSRHSVHSPFVYTLVDSVFKNKAGNTAINEIVKLRNSLSHNSRMIEITDFGSGSNHKSYSHRFENISTIVKKSSISKAYGLLLFRLVEYFKPQTVIELGTSLGISSLYMAMANPEAKVITVEGCTTKSEQASANFNALNVTNIELHIGRFDIILPDLINQTRELDFAFIDGNHTYEATVANFNALLAIAHNDTVFVFDDIHWSPGMQKAWDEITDHEKVTVSIDLFRMGIVFLRKELSKQKFVIRF